MKESTRDSELYLLIPMDGDVRIPESGSRVYEVVLALCLYYSMDQETRLALEGRSQDHESNEIKGSHSPYT